MIGRERLAHTLPGIALTKLKRRSLCSLHPPQLTLSAAKTPPAPPQPPVRQGPSVSGRRDGMAVGAELRDALDTSFGYLTKRGFCLDEKGNIDAGAAAGTAGDAGAGAVKAASLSLPPTEAEGTVAAAGIKQQRHAAAVMAAKRRSAAGHISVGRPRAPVAVAAPAAQQHPPAPKAPEAAAPAADVVAGATPSKIPAPVEAPAVKAPAAAADAAPAAAAPKAPAAAAPAAAPAPAAANATATAAAPAPKAPKGACHTFPIAIGEFGSRFEDKDVSAGGREGRGDGEAQGAERGRKEGGFFCGRAYSVGTATHSNNTQAHEHRHQQKHKHASQQQHNRTWSTSPTSRRGCAMRAPATRASTTRSSRTSTGATTPTAAVRGGGIYV